MTNDEFREAGKEATGKKGKATGTASGATLPARAPVMSAPAPRGPAPPAPRGAMMIPTALKPPFGAQQFPPQVSAPPKTATPPPVKKTDDGDAD